MVRGQPITDRDIARVGDPVWLAEVEATGGLTSTGSEAYALYDDDSLLACLGVKLLWDGLGEAWFKPAPSWQGARLDVHRIIRREVPVVMERMKLRRLQAHVYERHFKSCRWAISFGLVFEAKLWSFGPGGEHMLLFARFR